MDGHAVPASLAHEPFPFQGQKAPLPYDKQNVVASDVSDRISALDPETERHTPEGKFM